MRTPQIPHPKMPVKVDKPLILISIIPMSRPQPSHEEEPLQPHQSPHPPRPRAQEVSLTTTIAHHRPHHVQDSSREVTRGPHDANPLNQTPDLHPIIEARFEHLQADQERHEKSLDEHDQQFEVHERRMDRQAILINLMREQLRSFKEAQVENLGYT